MSQPGYVYIIRGVGTSYVKVGKTTSLLRRLRDLAQSVPFKIALLYTELVHDMDGEEQRLKVRYAPFRTRGEWFEFPPEALAAWPDILEEIKPIKPRAEKKTRTPRDRVLDKLLVLGRLTEREIGQRTGLRASILRPLMQTLVAEGAIDARPKGRTVAYLHPMLRTTDDRDGIDLEPF
jgi:hypothetical protein